MVTFPATVGVHWNFAMPLTIGIEALIGELEVFEYEQRPSGLLSYSAPDGYHDDCVMALALACNGLPAVNLPPVAASTPRVGRGQGRGF